MCINCINIRTEDTNLLILLMLKLHVSLTFLISLKVSNMSLSYSHSLISKLHRIRQGLCMFWSEQYCNSQNHWVEKAPKIPSISLLDALTCFHVCVNGCELEPLSVRKSLQRPVKPVGVWSGLMIMDVSVCFCTTGVLLSVYLHVIMQFCLRLMAFTFLCF